jgi:hypothetical protein
MFWRIENTIWDLRSRRDSAVPITIKLCKVTLQRPHTAKYSIFSDTEIGVQPELEQFRTPASGLGQHDLRQHIVRRAILRSYSFRHGHARDFIRCFLSICKSIERKLDGFKTIQSRSRDCCRLSTQPIGCGGWGETYLQHSQGTMQILDLALHTAINSRPPLQLSEPPEIYSYSK